MQRLRVLARYYVELLVKLGLLRFSLLVAFILIFVAIIVQVTITLLLGKSLNSMDWLRSVCFGLLITPWAVYFLSIVVEELESARQRLEGVVEKLKQLRLRDRQLNHQLRESLGKLHQAMDERGLAQRVQQETQSQLERQSSLLESFLDAAPDLVYYCNEDQQYMGCNRAMELLTGKSQKQLIGLTPEQLYCAEIAQKIMQSNEAVFRHNMALTYEQWLPYPDSRLVCFEIRTVPFYDRLGKRQGLMGFGRDITQHKRYQDALENASQEKTSFISTISHELRTPLNAIVGLSRLLLDEKLTAQQSDYLQSIYVSAVTLGNIFNDVIDIDKVGRNSIQINEEKLNVTDFVRDLQNVARLLVEQKGLAFQLILSSPLPDYLSTDATRLRQILWNLINNAIKFTTQGHITIEVNYLWQEQVWQFAVIDSGTGIPLSEQEKIFQMYYQGSTQEHNILGRGTGIGLYISRYLAQAMGGDITVESKMGEGARFLCKILAPVIYPEPLIDKENELLPALHILLVEDIELNVLIARTILEKLGNSVVTARDGQEALSCFADDEFDLILLDIQLPDMSGLEVVERLKQQYGKLQLPPIVALTANGTQDKQSYYLAGIEEVLGKPLAVDELTTLIARLWSLDGSTANNQAPLSREANNIDETHLKQYYQLVGKKQLGQAIQLFEQLMPSYLTNLEYYLNSQQWQELAEEGHKVKGAAGAMGLRRVSQLAQTIQHYQPSLEWQQQVTQAIQLLREYWLTDIAVVKGWLVEKNNPTL